jgi:DNA mismatch repair protein MutL
MAIIKRLSEVTINKIAAGEVVERPASALKEIIENAIDAGSETIEITLEESGKNLILVSDDGAGMSKDDLEMAIERHTTSKLDESDIMKIENFGFRGEALPSISSISRLSITSSQDGSIAYKINIEGGQKKHLQKSIRVKGTSVEIRDLFFATPARLKFLRSEKQELNHCKEIIKKIAMSHQNIAFKLVSNGKELLDYKKRDNREERILEILGVDFINNSSHVKFLSPDMNIEGMVSLPTYHKGTSEDQYLFINNRPVKDKLLLVAVKVAYQDFIEKGRHPIIVLFLNTDPRNVDVNVHPAKTEVRFHDPNFVRQCIISSVKDALYRANNRVSDTLSKKLNNILSGTFNSYKDCGNYKTQVLQDTESSNYLNKTKNLFQASGVFQAPSINIHKAEEEINYSNTSIEDKKLTIQDDRKSDMGTAICQINKTYIISQTENSILIVDQHAAHERLVYENLKNQIKNDLILRQRLLIPEIVDFQDEKHLNILEDKKEELSKLGLTFEKFSSNSVIIREVPRLISDVNIKKLILDIIDNLSEFEDTQNIAKLEEHIIETYACHHSIRAGRVLNIEEMNQLLQQMENTPFSGQCNHGRPTYVKLQIKDIEKLLGR